MMNTAQELLAKHNIAYVATKKSNYATNCPNCSGGYLNVKIQRDGVAWFCHQCQEGGRESFEQTSTKGSGELGPIKATHDYTDEASKLLFQVLRFEPIGQPKQFRQRTGPDQEKWSIKGVRIVPFRLPELIEDVAHDHTIFIVEGEKDVNTLRARNIPATCNPMGAGKWRDDFGPIFDGADVVICGDNDQPGRDHVALVAKNLHGVARRVRVLELKSFWPEIEESDDITDWFEAGHSVEQLWSFVDQVDDWHPSTNGQDDAAPPWEEPPPADENDHGETQPLPFINISEWDSEPVPTRQWAVADRIPLRQPTLFSGEGAIGKTLIALQLSVAHVTARDWLKTIPEPGSVIYVGAEDDTDELHRRLADICAHYNVRFADLTGNLHLLSFAGKDALLGIAGRDGIVKATSLFERLHRAARDKQPKLIVLDTVSDIFVGNENDRAQVRQFVALLRRLAIDTNAAVLVLSHPSLTGINSGTGLSGSTGWHNSVRARMYLKVAATEDGEEPAPELRELQFMKNNYGPLAERILLRWRNGVFVPEPGTGSLEKAAAEAKAENAFLDILARFNRQERNVSDKSGPTFAPALFAQEAEAKTTRIRKPALVDAMRRLFAANRIHLETYGKPSRPFKRLVPGAQP